jgi:hypothetical protein
VRWLDGFENRIGTEEFPPAGVCGVWYAVYWIESSMLQILARAKDHLLGHARCMALCPLHYGAKDKTIAVFYEGLGGRPDCGPQAGL